jgi:molecular chaperone DnaJ
MWARTQYAILGVAQTESHEGLRRVFRQLVKRYHPDRAGLGATAAFQQIINAYRILERAEWRKHYDKGINDVLQRQTGPGPEPIRADDIPY